MVTSEKTIGYYSVLGFKQEPFSSSPDPEFFFHTREHDLALNNLLIELRLRRGLSVVFGDVGTGKTTLSRKLLHELSKRDDFLFHIILNPAFNNEQQFLSSLIRNFEIDMPRGVDLKGCDIMELRDYIEKFLIKKTIEDGKTIVLLVDEAQKLDLATLETMRVLLNFETNSHKLIQLVLLGQLELYSKVVHMSNFLDRISFKFTLNPLDVHETKQLIDFRMRKAGYFKMDNLFSDGAVSEIYNYTKGYPRKIIMLCHKVLKRLAVNNQDFVDGSFARSVIKSDSQWRFEGCPAPAKK